MRFATLLVAVLAADAKPAGVDKDELKKIQGKWAVSRREHGGEVDDAKKVKGLRVEFAGTKWSVRDGDDVAEEGEVTALDGKAGAIDVKLTRGDDKGKVVRGIYKVDKTTVRMCIAEPDKQRPKKFAAEKGTGHTLFYLEKEKKE